MCVVALALHQHPDWPIVLVGNRDEVHARAAAPLHRWDDGSGIVAGRDLVGGGTWLGVHPELRRIAVITNIPADHGPDPAKASRGALVTAALTAEPTAPVDGDAFNRFTLLRLTDAVAHIATNDPEWRAQPLPPGIHAIANRPLGESCPRAAMLAAALRTCDPANEPALLAILRHGHDQDFVAGTAVAHAFLRNAAYGTRCSTLIRVNAAGRGTIWERRFDRNGAPAGDTQLEFAYDWAGISAR